MCCLATVARGHGLEIGTTLEILSVSWSIIVPSFMLVSLAKHFQPYLPPVAYTITAQTAYICQHQGSRVFVIISLTG